MDEASTSASGGAAAHGGRTFPPARSGVFYRFTQQNLPAWKPAMTTGCVVTIFFVIGITFVPVGLVCLRVSNHVAEIIHHYDIDCVPKAYRRNKQAYIKDSSISKNCTQEVKWVSEEAVSFARRMEAGCRRIVSLLSCTRLPVVSTPTPSAPRPPVPPRPAWHYSGGSTWTRPPPPDQPGSSAWSRPRTPPTYIPGFHTDDFMAPCTGPYQQQGRFSPGHIQVDQFFADWPGPSSDAAPEVLSGSGLPGAPEATQPEVQLTPPAQPRVRNPPDRFTFSDPRHPPRNPLHRRTAKQGRMAGRGRGDGAP